MIINYNNPPKYYHSTNLFESKKDDLDYDNIFIETYEEKTKKAFDIMFKFNRNRISQIVDLINKNIKVSAIRSKTGIDESIISYVKENINSL